MQNTVELKKDSLYHKHEFRETMQAIRKILTSL